MASIEQAFGHGSDRSKPPGFAEHKPEGKGSDWNWKGASQQYKWPVHGEEAATTASK